jgi:putative addiction module component (TIGR02574 family)
VISAPHDPVVLVRSLLGSGRLFVYNPATTLSQIPQIQELTKEEKLQLVEDLWDAIAALPDDLPVSDEEKALLDKRWRTHSESPADSLTLEDFKKRLAAHRWTAHW